MLQPHLVSCLTVHDRFPREADKFAQRGWTEVHSCLPCVPFRCAACGSTCRPLEPNRPRCTNDAGAPRCTCYSNGVQGLSLNDAIDMDTLPLPQEIKPRSIDLLTGIRIMHEAAALLQMQLLMATDDFRLSSTSFALPRKKCTRQVSCIRLVKARCLHSSQLTRC